MKEPPIFRDVILPIVQRETLTTKEAVNTGRTKHATNERLFIRE